MSRLISWNVNGIRAAAGKGFCDWLLQSGADAVGIQETKAQRDQLDESLLNPGEYKSYFFSAEKKGYSGVALYTKVEPQEVRPLGDDRFDSEGRVLIAEYKDFSLINCYFPNSQAEGKRLDYKLAFNQAILEEMDRIRASGRTAVLCGDFNVAHKPIDLENPKTNEKNPGYLPEERAWMDSFTEKGYVDTFRHFNKEPKQYSWWSYRMKARERNIGWRIDYFAINPEALPQLRGAAIHQEVMGSDHCPVSIDIDVEM